VKKSDYAVDNIALVRHTHLVVVPDNLGRVHAMTGDRHCIKIKDKEISRGARYDARYDAKDNAEWLA